MDDDDDGNGIPDRLEGHGDDGDDECVVCENGGTLESVGDETNTSFVPVQMALKDYFLSFVTTSKLDCSTIIKRPHEISMD